MKMLKESTMLARFLTYNKDINEIFLNIKQILVYLNIYYKTSNCINHGLEYVIFGECFRERVDKLFAFYVLYHEILARIFFNQLKFVSDFIVFNYYSNDDKQSFKHLQKILYNIYCFHIKKLIKKINSVIKSNTFHYVFNLMLTKEIKYNNNQLVIVTITITNY